MGFKSDCGGIAFKCNDAKLQANASTWGTRLSQLAKQKGVVRILTYSLPAMWYVRQQLGRRPKDIFLIAHLKFADRAKEIKAEFPDIRIAVHGKLHSKVGLVGPETIVISSANFGDSGWHETSVSFHSRSAHDWYVRSVFEPLWNESEEVRI
jgi:hypothetical protein